MQPELETHPHPADVAPTNPNTCQDIAVQWLWWMVALAAIGLAVCGLLGRSAHAQGHPPEHQAIHEQFYADWMRLDQNPTSSCCNKQDCFPTMMMQHTDGKWYALRQHRARELEQAVARGENPTVPPITYADWVLVPEHVIEQNAAREDLPAKKITREPRESPDGRSHACIVGDTVYCAVIGAAG
jgi:hypothetical protein